MRVFRRLTEHRQDAFRRLIVLPSAPRGPDVLLLTVDALRADHAREMGAYQRLAEHRLAFATAQAPSPWTLPSMATLMTGLPVRQHGAVKRESRHGRIGAGVRTLAERLTEIGYDTAAVVGPNDWLSPSFGFHLGFAVFEQPHSRHRFALPRLDRMGPARPLAADAVGLLMRGRQASGDAGELLSIATRILAARRERPLFLWVHFYDSHLPYFHADQADLPWRQRAALDLGLGRRGVLESPFWSSAEGLGAIDVAYRTEIGIIDEAILDLLDTFERRDGSDPIVILTSDHGEEFFEHGGFEHGHDFYQEILQIPLVISGASATRRVEPAPVGLVDLAPTILRLIGHPDRDLPGQGLDGPATIRPYVSRNLLHDAPPDAGFAVLENAWKAIYWSDGTHRLFRLDTDPGELHDLAAANADVLARLREAWQPADPVPDRPVELTEELIESLKAHGYLE